MTCRNCGTEIADKALICYRCGTATTEPRITPPDQRRPGPGPWPLVVVLLVLALVAGAAVTYVPEGTGRTVALVATVVAALAAFVLLRPGPGRARPRRR
ncbi:MAG: zinc-ribbon domain-containing protein [Vicinamibacterales bacterium]